MHDEHKCPLRRQDGLTLLEMMVALFLGSLLLGSVLMGVRQVQIWSNNLSLWNDRDGNSQLAPSLFSLLVGPSGNLLGTGEEGVEVSAQGLRLRSDLAGRGGFPDGDLDDRFERLTLRRKGSDLQLRSGEGSFQPLLRGVSVFRYRRLSPRRLEMRIDFRSQRPLMGTNRYLNSSLRLRYSLPNYRPNLFPE